MTEAPRLPTSLREFVDTEEWTFAKTMPEWPHEYLVRHRVDAQAFEKLVHHIRQHGREGRFYHRTLFYFEEDGLLYWTMVEKTVDGSWSYAIDSETIINRCKVRESYENRLKAGTLPEDLANGGRENTSQ